MAMKEFDIRAFRKIMAKYLGDPDGSDRVFFEALDFAAEAHAGQWRRSGDPYILHPCSVARILAEEMEAFGWYWLANELPPRCETPLSMKFGCARNDKKQGIFPYCIYFSQCWPKLPGEGPFDESLLSGQLEGDDNAQ